MCGSNGVAGDLESVLGTDARARVVAEEICQRVRNIDVGCHYAA